MSSSGDYISEIRDLAIQNSMMLVDYGSDDDSGSDAGSSPSIPTPLAPPPTQSNPPAQTTPVASSALSSGFQLPPPKSNSRRRDGPVKIKVEPPKPASEDDDSLPLKKQRMDEPSVRSKGAGASSLLSMLPAPKKTGVVPPRPTRILGSGASSKNDDPGVIMDFDNVTTSEADSSNSVVEGSAPVTSFIPSSMTRNKPKAPPAQPKTVSKPAAPATDFFSLGSKASSSLVSSTSSSSVISKPEVPSTSLSSAPVVTEYQPPPPTPTDPYPGYYQKPSGDWVAYDPGYYKSFWDAWQLERTDDGPSSEAARGKRKDRGWEGLDSDTEAAMPRVDASEEMKRGQIAQREAQKSLTGGPSVASLVDSAAAPRMNIKAKSVGRARQKGQLSSLLVEAYENRAAIEERIAAGRRNKKEAGNKYGF